MSLPAVTEGGRAARDGGKAAKGGKGGGKAKGGGKGCGRVAHQTRFAPPPSTPDILG